MTATSLCWHHKEYITIQIELTMLDSLARNIEYLTMTDTFSFTLRPSAIEGIGVFATHAIKANTKLHLFSDAEAIKIYPKQAGNLVAYFQRYCLWINQEYHCPEDFSRMSIGWYLNHADTPNAYHQDYCYFALCDIEAGEEVTIDYRLLGEDEAN